MFWWEIPWHLEVKGNRLQIAGLDAAGLAERHGTPLYVYNAERIVANYNRIKEAMEAQADRAYRIHYAVKANPHKRILNLLLEQGAWIDCVSPNECRLAIEAGYQKEKILFTGTSVSNEDLRELIEMDVMVTIDSFSQMRRMRELHFAGKCSIRWNPGKGAGGHAHTITAGKFVKFGIPEKKIIAAFKEAKRLGLDVVGLHQHIGSNWHGKDVKLFLQTVGKTITVAKKAEKVLGRSLEFIDFGGGPGIPYTKEHKAFPLEEYTKGIFSQMKKSGLKAAVAIEPGRYIVGDAGVLLVQVNTVEEKLEPIIGVNAGFNCLIRPAFYGSHHEIVLCNCVSSAKTKKFLVAGNLCESGDVFNESREELRKLPVPKEGDILALLNGGAYCMAMASNYNFRSKPKELLLVDGREETITDRDSLEDIVRKQV